MAEELYVNKNGFKCVMTQLAKTNGKDPQEYQLAKASGQDVKVLKTRVAKYEEA